MLTVSPPAQGVRAKAATDGRTIYGEVREAILNGAFSPGSRLPTERDLADQFHATRSTVRKTMSRLAAEGLIVRHVGRGTFVSEGIARATKPEEEFSLAELLEARLLFEPNLPDLVVERASEADIDAMDACVEAMRAAPDWVSFKEAKYALHLAIARASGNRFIVSIFSQILASRRRAGWDRAGERPMLLSAVREAAYEENVEIVDALKAEDADTARLAIRNYLVRTLSAAGMS
ncbi:GntR family transcriptional regulator [Acuticoccus sp. M5D2P5]|uniref:FadR/GntR family transcriptional regulator n=1 Tax=Acuticoccus kalidii TaxID=2910977 RepID=UPI001F3D874A|nr:GntR family transcriptional regulator [Acuticoccus kalidii]MCF3932733.1 GntR family transcriptional regulator [Acuticoccus kalidii]